ncbi:nucleoside deaminase [Streptomyces omiyaensis]|uniref:nucleoside deaminase n=1 Tax=Streptomyces omiyaensis TaxID=68247 RepID=UPI001E5A3E08|nr:nucleoside deaminase [Streptomyces omiyaensis]
MTIFDEAWPAAPEAVRRCLALAYEALRAGGLAVGSVLTDANGTVRAEGRNQAYDDGPGAGALRGTPLAHAELNALAAARTEWDLGTLTLWSTQEPCSMCTAAAAFTGVGAVRYLAPDPWALASANHGSSGVAGLEQQPWLVAANVMFLRSVAVAARGPEEPATLVRCRELEPETAALHDSLPPGLPSAPTAEAWLRELWPGVAAAALARPAGRHGGGGRGRPHRTG